jgi:tripartite-type tricarboxylate transporter receptor subunit TctC
MTESGYGGIEATYWNGMLAPAGTPAGVVKRLNGAINTAVALSDVSAALRKLGSDPKTGTSEEFAALIAAEVKRWSKVVREANIQIQ